MAESESKNFIEEIIESDLKKGVVAEVVTRFPPEPNGYLHLGHAKAICLNFGLAEEYNGKCNLRFDDTNPLKEDAAYVDAIKKDIEWLGFSWDKEVYGSDYFEYMYACAQTLIKKGLAFVDDLSAEQMREYRGTLTEPGKESPYRDRSVEENLDLFTRMKAGEFADGEKILRAKIDMASPNLNMRDPAIYRIVKSAHHRTGDKWVIYPMYDFAHPLEDAFEGITHSVCTMEFEDHRPLYDWFVKNCDCENVPHQYEFARLNLTNTVMSKRYLKKLVDDGVVSGWDDPRMPTLSGVRRRGYTPEAIRDFCERIGVAKAVSEVDVRLLEHCVREDLNAHAPRVMAVLRPLKLTIENYPDNETEMLTAEDLPGGESRHEVPFSKHLYIEQDDFMEEKPNNKYFRLYVGGEVRLKNAYIIKCERAVKDADGNVVEVVCSYDPSTKSGGENSGKKVKGTLHWVDADTAVRAQVRLFDHLFLEQEDGTYVTNENSMVVLDHVLVEPHILSAQKGDRFQFMRQGYFAIDPTDSTDNKLVFNQIVSLKDSFAKQVLKGN
ncbi:MAG: glutamine--tRNA ligase/YqeY domain fusion protein [Christensenella sp.]|uniref:glutamine--tRNA ligase/YqeY domain fusion protein n=1 Tax=Christensenella sp. TaxID=1935934 RepID=UPI002B20E1B8|nr:glutamine--tRNA ligase/YqeY domain fusion protein [Christensenella sp.]MEA5002476.1 glutamine--tRNA ligase/YqeY domain fusion protein [Christensenella sp.]